MERLKEYLISMIDKNAGELNLVEKLIKIVIIFIIIFILMLDCIIKCDT